MARTRRNRKPRRNRHRFTKEECQRGYRAALEKCAQNWDLYAWFYYRVRGFYRHRKELVQ
jgi:hypothetical protein